MLTVRQQQMDSLSAYMTRQFEDRTLAHLRSDKAAQIQGQSEGQLRATIRRGIERAGYYGITLEPDVQRYIDLMVRCGAEFDAAAATRWAGTELRKRAVPARKRLDAIEQRLESHP